MDCAGFERWLDEAPDDAEMPAAAGLHAESCARCRAALTAAQSIESALAAPPPGAPAGFATGVMARVRADVRVRRSSFRLLRVPAMPWWVRVAADPSVVVALGLAAVLMRGPETVTSVASAVAPYLQPLRTLLTGAQGLASSFPSPLAQTGFVAGMLPVVVLLSIALYGWLQRICSGPSLMGTGGHGLRP